MLRKGAISFNKRSKNAADFDGVSFTAATINADVCHRYYATFAMHNSDFFNPVTLR